MKYRIELKDIFNFKKYYFVQNFIIILDKIGARYNASNIT
jgi:hypothetical protein